jgi:L-lactate dehydrogenase complex protein LldE
MDKTVELFATCLVETLRPEAGMAVVQVLEGLGITVQYPKGQTCCGQPAFNAGAWDEARAMARHTLRVLAPSDDPIVVPSGSCADMLVHHYPELFTAEPEYAELADRVAARTYEFSQYVVDFLGATTVRGRAQARIAYHPSCHLLRGLQVTEPPRKLLGTIEGAELVELPGAAECCGFGGLFAIKMSELSGAMLDRKLDAIDRSGADIVVGCDVSCLLHIRGGLHRRGSGVRTKHLAELLVPDS